MQPCKTCNVQPIVTEIGTTVCPGCGCENFGPLLSIEQSYTGTSVPLHATATYTRVKRFKKYLQRACMTQSASTIPQETWDYLEAGMPYSGPGSIVRRLKKAPKTIRKKCYDSLPLLVKLLCPHIKVPLVGECDKRRCLHAFQRLDAAYCRGEPFVSYLFALEFIFRMIGRSDMVPFINKISCRKRRAEYTVRLKRIFA